MPTRREALRSIAAGSAALLVNRTSLGALAQQRPDELLIRGGRVVNEDSTRIADVRVIRETIAEVGSGLKPGPGARLIDAAGRLVVPGGIDPHTHLNNFGYVDDFTSGSMAALAGGITTFGTFAFANPGEPVASAMERLARRVPAEAIADVILHACAWPPTSDVIQAVPALAASGQPSFKVFMTEADFGTRLNDVARLIEAARDAGVVTMVHCEDAAILSRTVRALTEEGRTSLRDFGASRPVSAEIAATEQMSAICISLRAPVYAVHVSSGRAMDVCRQTRKSGAPLFVETRPVFLHLTDERLRGADAALHTTWPTLRPSSDRQQLWRALADGTVDTLGSDHVAVTRAQKLDPSLTITNSRPGMSDLQFMLPMLYSEGVRERRLTLQRFVAATSTNAARIFGLYPRKGVIQEGSDADIVLWDPDRRATVTAAADFSKAGYSVYEGWRVTGWPVMTIRRGEVVFESGRVTGRAGTGQLLSRSRWRP